MVQCRAGCYLKVVRLPTLPLRYQKQQQYDYSNPSFDQDKSTVSRKLTNTEEILQMRTRLSNYEASVMSLLGGRLKKVRIGNGEATRRHGSQTSKSSSLFIAITRQIFANWAVLARTLLRLLRVMPKTHAAKTFLDRENQSFCTSIVRYEKNQLAYGNHHTILPKRLPMQMH